MSDVSERSVVIVDNPRTGEELYRFEEPMPDEVAGMYARARAAQAVWGGYSVERRMRELAKLKKYMLENRSAIAEKIVAETGKALTDAMMMEIFNSIDTIDFYERHAPKMLAAKTVVTPIMLVGKKSKVFYDPMGVVLIISPWNYPFNLSIIPALNALIAGNAVLLKPSRYTPLKGVVEEMIEKSGFMKDLFQVVYASRKTAGALIDARPDKIHFTGSVGVGRHIMKQASEKLIPVELELGGKDPFIVFDDVNLERTVNGALWGTYANCGQTCISVERIFVQDTLYDSFLALFKEKAAKLVTLAKLEKGADERDLHVGCMTAEFQLEEIEQQLAEAREKGANIVLGGERIPGTRILPPTIVTGADNSFAIHRDESFGPVVTITPFKDEDEAVRLANDSVFGLSSSVWSADIARAERVAHRLQAGSVAINNVMATLANPALPFGGVLDSGFGRYRGELGLHAFSNIKAVLVDKQADYLEPYWYPYSKEKFGLLMQVMDAVFGGSPLGLLKVGLLKLKLDSFTKKNRL